MCLSCADKILSFSLSLSHPTSEYDVCGGVIEKQRDLFCALGACECPLRQKEYASSNLRYPLPSVGGPVFAQILEGNFEGSIRFFHADSGREYGCLGVALAISAATSPAPAAAPAVSMTA